MRQNFITCRMAHVAQLLGKCPGGKKLYAISMICCWNNDSQQFVAMPDGNNICHVGFLSAVS